MQIVSFPHLPFWLLMTFLLLILPYGLHFQGASTNRNMMEWDKLWSINKSIIDPVCPRHTAVLDNRRVMISLIDGPVEPVMSITPRHKKFKDAGDKCIYYTKNIWIDYVDALSISANDEVTLMDWGNAIFKKIKRNEKGTVVQLIGVLNLEGSVKDTRLKLTWLPDMDELVKLQLVEFDYLILSEKLVKSNKRRDRRTRCKRKIFSSHLTLSQERTHGPLEMLTCRI